MLKPILALAAACLLPGVLQAQVLKPMRMVESKPVTVNGIEFVAIVPSEWIVQEPRTPPPRPGVLPVPIALEQIDVQLRLTNRTDKDLVVLLGNVFSLELRNAAGVPQGGRPIPSKVPERPVVVAAGKSHYIQWPITIVWQNRREWFAMRCEHRGRDIFLGGRLTEGAYSLSAEFTNTEKLEDIGGIPVWRGTASTPGVPFLILLPPKRA